MLQQQRQVALEALAQTYRKQSSDILVRVIGGIFIEIIKLVQDDHYDLVIKQALRGRYRRTPFR